MLVVFFIFFFNDTATTEIYTLSLHDALPISHCVEWDDWATQPKVKKANRSEEHTSELQSHVNLVCRLLLEKKKHDRPAHQGSPGCDRPQAHAHRVPARRRYVYISGRARNRAN